MRTPAASLGFGVGFAACWFAASVTRLPLLWYLPLEHRFVVATAVVGLGMDFYGRLLLAGAVGLSTGALAWGLGRRATPRWLLHGAVWVGTLVALNLALQLALLVNRHPVPLGPP